MNNALAFLFHHLQFHQKTSLLKIAEEKLIIIPINIKYHATYQGACLLKLVPDPFT